MDIKRVILTTLCCIVSGFLFIHLIKWDWSFFIIPILMSLSISLTNYDLISIHKKWLGILLYVSLSVMLFFITIGITFGISTKVDDYTLVFSLGCAFSAILFTLITYIILPFHRFWVSLLIITILSSIAFPVATYLYEKPLDIAPIFKGRENISVVWMTLVGLGISIGIHYRKP